MSSPASLRGHTLAAPRAHVRPAQLHANARSCRVPDVWFLQRRDSPDWWAAVAEHPFGAPGLIQELLRGPSAVCDRNEAMQALAWAKAHPAWRDDLPALEVVDTRRRNA